MACENAQYDFDRDGWVCLGCDRFFKEEDALKAHQGIVSAVLCAVCLIDGFRTVAEDRDGRFFCPRCGDYPKRVLTENPGGGGLYANKRI